MSRLQCERAVLSEDGKRASQDGTQHPCQCYHCKTHVLAHPGLQVVHDTPEMQIGAYQIFI